MTTPMSLQPWSWQIFILIQLWWQFFQMLVYGDVVHTQTWYWPWKLTVSSHLHMSVRPMLLLYGPPFFPTLSQKFGQPARFFWANGLPPPPPRQKISRTPMKRNDFDRESTQKFSTRIRQKITHIYSIQWWLDWAEPIRRIVEKTALDFIYKYLPRLVLF